MDKSLIKTMHDQWREVKAGAQRQCEQRGLSNLAEAYRTCAMFKGTESLEEIARLFKTTQAVEFCMKYHFPNLATLRAFKQDNPERFGIFIDAGSVILNNPKEKVLLVGRTTAIVNCNELRSYEVACLHGAKVIINASGWAVVRAEAENPNHITKNISNNAVIL